MNYIKDPKIIYKHSFEKVRQICELSKFHHDYHNMVIRMVHGSANPAIINDIVISGDPIRALKQTLKPKERKEGTTRILVDCNMLKAGIASKYLPKKTQLICSIEEKEVIENAKKYNLTKSMEQVDFWLRKGWLAGSIIIIGNAPTCLFRLLEIVKKLMREFENTQTHKHPHTHRHLHPHTSTHIKNNPNNHNNHNPLDHSDPTYLELQKLLPAAIFAFPVGFIGAKEAKAELITSNIPLSYVSLKGIIGGSAIAAAAFNAILLEL